MTNRIGREHPYQQIKDAETAARMALDEVLKLSDEGTEECAYNPNYLFGAWYLEFLCARRRAKREGSLFTREAGEERIMSFFHPSPEEAERRKREREEEYEYARRQLDERVAAKREATGCYAEDGLYERVFDKTSETLLLRFVDGSSIMATPQGIRENIYRPMDYFNMATMARKWFDSAGYEGVQKIADEAKGCRVMEAANGD